MWFANSGPSDGLFERLHFLIRVQHIPTSAYSLELRTLLPLPPNTIDAADAICGRGVCNEVVLLGVTTLGS